MPGVIEMEPAGQNGSRTDHDRKHSANGVNGMDSAGGHTTAPSKDKAMVTSNNNCSVNGSAASDRQGQPTANVADSSTVGPPRMNNLPDEIVHITQGFIPLSLLLSRLAQVSHNALQDKIVELAKMPLPAAAVNGNAALTSGGGTDDSSTENLRKKGNLATFAQDWHGKWLKALVITEWSRKSEMVSKLIDLKFHIDQQRILFDAALDNVINIKRDLTYARMPSPDLKTALQVLSTGKAPWMPDLYYIDPDPLTPSEQLKWMNDLNTLLSLRLNLEEFDKIPYRFRNYEIDSGRVTFKVEGEFEVDLTIADEDFEKQFWFIDFRYSFKPSASSLSPSLRAYLEGCVNEALCKDGLAGCYQFLHEFVLTCKINEIKRQALQLSRSSWSGTLSVEPLNRALAIQYWTSRTAPTGPKSWILLGVNSGRKPNGETDPKISSSIVAKWYRDGKEVTGAEIEIDLENISAQALLTNVVGQHINYILTSIHDKLKSAPRYKNREASMILRLSGSDPAASTLSIQVGFNDSASLALEPRTGVFAVKPHSKFSIQYENQLNTDKSAAEDGANCLENVRGAIMEDGLHRRGSCMGWRVRKSPISLEETRSVTKLREWTRTIWLQKDGWGPSWFVCVFLGLAGDEWRLIELATPSKEPASHHNDEPYRNRNEPQRTTKFKTKLPLHKGYPDQSQAFWDNLVVFTTGTMTQSIDARELHRQKIKSRLSNTIDPSVPQQVRLPSIEISLSALFPTMVSSEASAARRAASTRDGNLNLDNVKLFSLMQKYTGMELTPKQAWADDLVHLKFKGIQPLRETLDDAAGDDLAVSGLLCVSDAIIKVRRPSTFATLKCVVDRDVSYNSKRGEFSLRIRRAVGKPILDLLKSRIQAIDRFVNFFEAVTNARGAVVAESVTLKRVTFSYGTKAGQKGDADAPKPLRISLDLSKDDIEVEIEEGNPHLRVLDLMRRLVNSDGGIGALMAWLPASLPALEAVDEMETRWDELQAEKRGRLEFSMKTIAWLKIGYTVGGTGAGGGDPKRVAFDLRMKPRRGEAWWHIWRSDAQDASKDDESAPQDEFAQALRAVWNGKGDGWLGLATGAASRPCGGVHGMLLAVDEAVRAVVSGEASTGPDQGQIQDQDRSSTVVVLD
ncbi:hypothetical protein HIM_01287 [Hirsutella minnesotensis 3608]|nr:hypothetical protein HIM_01287 [Hirsutella minnesotensis 3608]